MSNCRHTPEQALRKLREADRLLSGGQELPEVLKHLEIAEATYHLWRNQYGGMKADDVKHLKELEAENSEAQSDRRRSGPGYSGSEGAVGGTDVAPMSSLRPTFCLITGCRASMRARPRPPFGVSEWPRAFHTGYQRDRSVEPAAPQSGQDQGQLPDRGIGDQAALPRDPERRPGLNPDARVDQSNAGVENPIRRPDPQLTTRPAYTVFRTPSVAAAVAQRVCSASATTGASEGW
jgi:putative transposase